MKVSEEKLDRFVKMLMALASGIGFMLVTEEGMKDAIRDLLSDDDK